jgi:hypothetical protein
MYYKADFEIENSIKSLQIETLTKAKKKTENEARFVTFVS